jgi:hypothetical protein
MTKGFVGRLPDRPPVMQAANSTHQTSLNWLSESTTIDQIKLDQTAASFPTERQENYGLSVTCDGPSTFLPECRTSDTPEIMVWGDSFAMQLVPGILASNPDVKLIQMTKSVCGPFFDLSPISEPDFPARWARDCLAFNGRVRDWLRANNTVKYVVLASPFSPYFVEGGKLLHRNGEYLASNFELALQELKVTLSELKLLGVQPIIFAPPPAANFDLGRCLARAEWVGLGFDTCDFREDEISTLRIRAYQFLELVQDTYPVFRIDRLMCQDSWCKPHNEGLPLYRDGQHFSETGSRKLGEKHDFYQIITDFPRAPVQYP